MKSLMLEAKNNSPSQQQGFLNHLQNILINQAVINHYHIKLKWIWQHPLQSEKLFKFKWSENCQAFDNVFLWLTELNTQPI